jgi:hypothetical protein
MGDTIQSEISALNYAEQYLQQCCSLMQGRPHKFRRLLEIGRSPKREEFTKDEERQIAALKRAVRPQRKQCFRNCQRALMFGFDEFRYWEGFYCPPRFAGLSFEHAWLTLNGKLVDLAPNCDGDEHYFGVPIETQTVRDFMIEGKLHGPLLDDIELRWKYAQKILGDIGRA